MKPLILSAMFLALFANTFACGGYRSSSEAQQSSVSAIPSKGTVYALAGRYPLHIGTSCKIGNSTRSYKSDLPQVKLKQAYTSPKQAYALCDRLLPLARAQWAAACEAKRTERREQCAKYKGSTFYGNSPQYCMAKYVPGNCAYK